MKTPFYLSLILSIVAIGSSSYSAYYVYQTSSQNSVHLEKQQKAFGEIEKKFQAINGTLEELKKEKMEVSKKTSQVPVLPSEPVKQQEEPVKVDMAASSPNSSNAIKIGLSCYEAQRRGIERLKHDKSKEALEEVETMVSAACPKE